MSRLDELYEMRAALDAAIEQERTQLWAMADLRDQVHDLLSTQSAGTAATLTAVAQAYSVTVVDIVGRDRTAEAMAARHVTAWLLHNQGMSYAGVGRILGRDHTTVMNSCRRVAESTTLSTTADRIRTELTAVVLERVAS